MIRNAGKTEPIISHYLFALSAYRGLYILNWVYRYYSEGFYDLIAIISGIIQFILYGIYFLVILAIAIDSNYLFDSLNYKINK